FGHQFHGQMRHLGDGHREKNNDCSGDRGRLLHGFPPCWFQRPATPVASRGKKGILLVPLGGTKLNWASSTAASAFQSLRAVLMLSRAGVSVSVTTYLRGNGRLPSAIQTWKSTPGRLNSR